jgi:threonine dehydrogenase-like Zn-dependent dehydrogenase
MAGNRAVAYLEPGRVAVQDTPYPRLEIVDGPGVNRANVGRKVEHGVILKVVSTNICGSDQHMVRGRTTAPAGLALGHEITGEVIEAGRDVEFIKVGDLCSVPFNIACGRCRKCKERKTCICLNVNPDRPGSAYGYIAGAGPVGLAAAVSAQLLGAAVVIVADLNEERLAQARSLMMAILHERVQIAKAVNATVISLEEAPRGYADFDSGVAKKFVIDPHGMIPA